MKTRGKLSKGKTRLDLSHDDCGVVLRANGTVDVIVPEFAPDEIVPDQILAMMMLSTLLEGDGIELLSSQFKAMAKDEGFGVVIQ